MRRLVIHIGSEKTGTTSIQNFMSANRKILESQGIIYPEIGFSKTAHFSLVAPFHPLDNNGKGLEFAPEESYDPKEEWSNIKCLFDSHESVTVVVSAEHFSSRLKEKGISALKETVDWACPDVEVLIVYYVRRQDKYFQSWYSTHIKAGGTLPLKKAYNMRLGQHWFYDYYHIACAWESEFGENSVKVIPFEKEQLEGGLINNFCSIFGVFPDERFDFKVKDSNESWSFKFLQFARLVNVHNQMSPIPNRFKLLNEFSAYFEKKQTDFLSPEEANVVIERYAASNVKLAEKFLGRESGDLFFSSYVDPEGWEEPQGIRVVDLVPMFVDMAQKIKR